MARASGDLSGFTMVLRKRRNHLASTLAALFLGLLAVALIHEAVARDLAGATAPDFALQSTAGENLRLSEYRSEVVALAFWASWCGECRSQLPALGRLQRGFDADGLQVLAVNLDRDLHTATKATADLGVAVPVLYDEGGRIGRLYGVPRLPLLVLVDREGQVRAVHQGYRNAEEQELTEEIRALLTE